MAIVSLKCTNVNTCCNDSKILDGHGFTRERKTRLLQMQEERKEPQSTPSNRQMTTAEFAVVCLFSFPVVIIVKAAALRVIFCLQ